MVKGEERHDSQIMRPSSWSEATLHTISSLATLIPGVGSPIASFLAQQATDLMERRVQDGLEVVSEKIRNIPEKILYSEEFASATITIFRLLQYEHSKEKRHYFSNIYNRFIMEAIDEKLEIETFSLFSSITANLSPESFILLLLLPQGNLEFDEFIGQQLVEKDPSLSLPYARRSLVELEREHLIWEQPLDITKALNGGNTLIHKKFRKGALAEEYTDLDKVNRLIFQRLWEAWQLERV